MKTNSAFTQKTQRIDRNFIARTVQRNAPTAIAGETNHTISHSTSDNVKPFELLPNIPSSYVLPRQNPPINNEQNDDLVAERCVHDVDDYDDLLETDANELPNIPLAYVLPRQNPPINNEQNDDLVTERCVHDVDDYDDLLETDVSDIDLLANNQVDEMHRLINEIAGVDINRKLKIVNALNTTEEKKHDILMNDMTSCDFMHIDRIEISDEEKFKRKLAFIDEAYYDPDTREKKHSEFVEAYNAKFTENK